MISSFRSRAVLTRDSTASNSATYRIERRGKQPVGSIVKSLSFQRLSKKKVKRT